MTEVKGKNKYVFSEDGKTGYGFTITGEMFLFDAEDFDKIKDIVWYKCNLNNRYVGNATGKCIHRYILPTEGRVEIDHINHNPMDNRKNNLRICTHQQNQCNQLLQKNNTSGITGVSFYASRNKYRARIKICQHDIHLGYYKTFIEAVQARNIGMECMFGEYGVYNDVPDTPKWIRDKVINICKRFANLSICEAFINFIEEQSTEYVFLQESV